ncbi:MAG TPA: hypothetical protein VGM26_17385 [Rhizomicrobium sp.]|jgi:hypothetical protein
MNRGQMMVLAIALGTAALIALVLALRLCLAPPHSLEARDGHGISPFLLLSLHHHGEGRA